MLNYSFKITVREARIWTVGWPPSLSWSLHRMVCCNTNAVVNSINIILCITVFVKLDEEYAYFFPFKKPFLICVFPKLSFKCNQCSPTL